MVRVARWLLMISVFFLDLGGFDFLGFLRFRGGSICGPLTTILGLQFFKISSSLCLFGFHQGPGGV